MAGEFKIKTGLQLGADPTKIVTSITDSSSFSYDSSSVLVTVSAVKGFVDKEIFIVDSSISNLSQWNSILDISLGNLESSINTLFTLDSSSIKGGINVGDGSASIYAGITADGSIRFREIAGSGATMVSQVDDLIIISIDASFSGETNTASNISGGDGSIFRTKVAQDLVFRSLKSTDSNLLNIRTDSSFVLFDISTSAFPQDPSVNSLYDYIDGSLNLKVSESSLGSNSFFYDSSGYLQTASSSGFGVVGKWRFKDITTDSDPGSGSFRLNNADSSLANYIYINNITTGGADLKNILLQLKTDDYIYIQQLPDSTQYATYRLIADSIDSSTYIKLNILSYSIGSSFDNNKECGFIVLLTGRNQYATLNYVDSSLLTRDSSISALFAKNANQDTSINNLRTYIDGSLSTRDGSITALFTKNSQQDSSILNLINWNRAQDVSILRSINAISTGLLSGGVLSINTDTSLYNISAGMGYIIDNHTDPLHPLVIDVSWNAFTGIKPVNLLTQLVTYVSINSSGTITESVSPLDSTGRRNYIYLGTVVHSNQFTINAVNNQPTVSPDIGAQLQDLMQSFGFRSISGNRVSNYDADLRIKKEEGMAFKPGANFQTLNTNPHIFSLPALSPITFRYRTQSGSEGSNTIFIDPTTWDSSGTITTIPNNNDATIQRIYVFPSNLIRIQRGQYVYNNLTEAISKIGSENFNIEKNIAENGLFLGSIALRRNCTDLSNLDQAVFISSSGVYGTGMSSSFATLQQSYDISYPPQITGDLTIDGSLYIGNHRLMGVALPIDSSDATNRYYVNNYVDNSISARDVSINNLRVYLDGSLSTRDGSITSLFTKNENQDVSINRLRTYIDGSLSARDSSITALFTKNSNQDTSINNLRVYLDGSLNSRDISVAALFTKNASQDVSINNLRTYTDGSLNVKVDRSIFDSSISYLKTYDDQRWIDINRCGFVNENDVSVRFDSSTYIVTVSPINSSTWTYIRGGLKITISGDSSVLVGNPPPSGMNFITINNNIGQLTSSQSAWTLLDQTLPVCTVLWNNTLTPKYQFAEEKHQALMDRRTHAYLHFTEGTKFISGGILTGPTVNGTTNLTNTFGVSETVIADEDMFETLPVLTRPDGSTHAYTLFYRTNASTWIWEDCSVPYKYGPNNRIMWDSSLGVITEAANTANRWYNWYLFFTNLAGRARYSMIPGRGIFTSLALAQAEDPKLFDFTGYPIAEGLIAYQMTWEYVGAQSNLGKVRLAATPKKINVTTVSNSVSSGSTIHNTLSGLQGGVDSEYYHLTSAQYTDFVGKTYIDGSLSARDLSLNWMSSNKADTSYVDGSLGNRDTSINNLRSYIDGSLSARDTSIAKSTEIFSFACSDETTALTTGPAKITYRMPFNFYINEVRSSVTLPPQGSSIIVDINENGNSVLSTRVSIDASTYSSVSSSTPPVISDTSLGNDSQITIDIDQVGSTTAGTGLKVTLIGYKL